MIRIFRHKFLFEKIIYQFLIDLFWFESIELKCQINFKIEFENEFSKFKILVV